MSLTTLLAGAPASPTRRTVSIGGVAIGGREVPVIAGPCAVEPGYVDHAVAVHGAGARALRGSIFKPRTRPTAFQGLGADGLELLDAARAATGAPVVVEPLSVEHVSLLAGRADALMIGARSMQNTPLLRAAGRSGLPVILKRGMAATYDEWLAACEYVVGEGNEDVILCERGIRTFETATRNTLDLAAIPVLRERTGMPVIVDPSHAAGNRDWVPALALAAVAAGADGLLVEAHPDPEASWSDAAQAVTPQVLAAIVDTTAVLAGVLRPGGSGGMSRCRTDIDAIDAGIGVLLDQRAAAVRAVQRDKRRRGLGVRDREREAQVVMRVAARVQTLAPDAVAGVMGAIIDACVEGATSGGVEAMAS